MSSSDSDLNFSVSCDSDSDSEYHEDLYENLIFHLICQEPSLFKMTRKSSGVKDRIFPLNFIHSWTNEMFYRH